jgi:hypothetical protein
MQCQLESEREREKRRELYPIVKHFLLAGRQREAAERSLALARPREQLDVVRVAAVLEPDPAGGAGDEVRV